MTRQTETFLNAAQAGAEPIELARLLLEAERAETDPVLSGKFEEIYQTVQALQRELRDVWRMQAQLKRVVDEFALIARANVG